MMQQTLDYDSAPKRISYFAIAKQMLRRWWPVWVALMLIVGFVAFTILDFTIQHVDEPAGYSTPDAVKDYTGFSPPAGAAKLQTAGYRHGMILSHYVRFEAPVDQCLAFAKQVAHGKTLTSEDVMTLDGGIIRQDQRHFTHFNWFDLPTASNLVGANIDGDEDVWVDQARGIFYFFRGD